MSKLTKKQLKFLSFKKSMLAYYRTCQVVKNGKKCGRRATDLHHCLIRRDKRFSWIDKQKWNFQPTCAECNRITHDADRLENRQAWARHQYEVHGDLLLINLSGAPDKIKMFSQDYADTMDALAEYWMANEDS